MSIDSAGRFPSDSAVVQKIAAARRGDLQSLGDLLSVYQDYLAVLASRQLDHRLRRRLSTSDLVQETMLGAYRDFAQFRGNSVGELKAWLRQILINCLRHAIEKNVYAKKRDIRREVAWDTMARRLDESRVRLSHIVADKAATPSEEMMQRESLAELYAQLAKLKQSYRDVIVYRNLQRLSFDQIALRMDIKPGAARMLWVRAIAKFKDVCQKDSHGDAT